MLTPCSTDNPPLYGLPLNLQENLDPFSMDFQKSQYTINKGGFTLWPWLLKRYKRWYALSVTLYTEDWT